ncbi:hypothetical protein FKW77_003740 [Venturia effusa]|uniref:Uncharacterized protein n=1 Tax=Venturia effusa TaxID=50376 RepID=A0A517LL78_9PEZI|nr:hypothetical protein FKW77_003740 [Venturia effusa]
MAIQFLDSIVVFKSGAYWYNLPSFLNETWATEPSSRHERTSQVQDCGTTAAIGQTSAPEDMVVLPWVPRSEEITHRVCDCVGRTLHERLRSTFFSEADGILPVWNELSGRSTTQAEDVPVILTNMLNLDNGGLLTLRTTRERFQVILLSLEKIPLSLFFNEALRHDRSDRSQNRWIPEQVNLLDLSIKKSLSVFKSHVSYIHKGNKSKDGISIYIIDAVIPLDSEIRVLCDNDSTFYVIGPTFSNLDQLITEGFSSTCIMVGASLSTEALRGACFYVRNVRTGHRIGLGWWVQPLRFAIDSFVGTLGSIIGSVHFIPMLGRPFRRYLDLFNALASFDMTFECPVSLRQAPLDDISSAEARQSYRWRPVDAPSDFKIRFGM